jgi:hypothetical protein
VEIKVFDRSIAGLAMIGAGAGLLSVLMGRAVAVITDASLFSGAVASGAAFVLTGVGIAWSLHLLDRPGLISRDRLLAGGIAGGFLFGAFVGLGFLGYYVGFVVLSIGLCIGIRTTRAAFCVLAGSLAGAFLGTMVGTVLSIVVLRLDESFVAGSSAMVAFLAIPLNLYFVNIGALIALSGQRARCGV